MDCTQRAPEHTITKKRTTEPGSLRFLAPPSSGDAALAAGVMIILGFSALPPLPALPPPPPAALPLLRPGVAVGERLAALLPGGAKSPSPASSSSLLLAARSTASAIGRSPSALAAAAAALAVAALGLAAASLEAGGCCVRREECCVCVVVRGDGVGVL